MMLLPGSVQNFLLTIVHNNGAPGRTQNNLVTTVKNELLLEIVTEHLRKVIHSHLVLYPVHNRLVALLDL